MLMNWKRSRNSVIPVCNCSASRVCPVYYHTITWNPVISFIPMRNISRVVLVYSMPYWRNASRRTCLFSVNLRHDAILHHVSVSDNRRDYFFLHFHDHPLAALIPQAEEISAKNKQDRLASNGFHVHYLPYADDIRTLPKNDTARASNDETDLFKNVIRGLKFKYRADRFENPALQTLWRNIEATALNKNEPEEFVDLTVPNVENQNQKVEKYVDQIKQTIFPPDYVMGQTKRSAPKRKVSFHSRSNRCLVSRERISVENLLKRNDWDEKQVMKWSLLSKSTHSERHSIPRRFFCWHIVVFVIVILFLRCLFSYSRRTYEKSYWITFYIFWLRGDLLSSPLSFFFNLIRVRHLDGFVRIIKIARP